MLFEKFGIYTLILILAAYVVIAVAILTTWFRQSIVQKVYVGTRDHSGASVRIHYVSRRLAGRKEITWIPLDHIVEHSPTGLEWGYPGSGPADLAISILTDATGSRETARRHYHAFKTDVVCVLPRPGFRLPAQDVLDWIHFRETELKHAPHAV